MTDLLQQFSQFLNLQKLIAITVPGMLMTIALLVFMNPPKCQTDPNKCWYCQGEQSKDTTASDSAADGSASNANATRPEGSILISKLNWRTANSSYRRLDLDPGACDAVPVYLVSDSYLKQVKENAQNFGDLQTGDPQTLLRTLDRCSVALNLAYNNSKVKEKAEQQIITTLSASMTNLAAKLESSQETANGVLERTLRVQLNTAKQQFAAENESDQRLLNQMTIVGGADGKSGLIGQVAGMQTAVSGKLQSIVAPEQKPAPTTWQDAANKISSSILLFIFVSMLVGQILDPIQRTLVSLEPLRGFLFPFLNYLYSPKVSWGGIRFGDHRYVPREQTSQAGDGSMERKVLEPRDLEPNVYEADFAIGRGLLTETEYSGLKNTFYSESQITTGLILPTLALALVWLVRTACCQPGTTSALTWVFTFGLVGFVLTLIALWLVLKPFKRNGKEKEEEFEKRAAKAVEWRIPIGALALLVTFIALGFIAFFAVGKSLLLATIPTVLDLAIMSLYLLGMDRLHNFYSEVQSRIAGSFEKQADSQIKKTLDILTNPKSRDKFISQLNDMHRLSQSLLDKLK